MTNKLPYQGAIVTGASSGIGAEIAKKLCQSGITVLAVARKRQNLEKVKKALHRDHQKYFIPTPTDISKEEDLSHIVSTAQNYKVDLLINNAGVGKNTPFEVLTQNEIEAQIQTNLVGHVLLTQKLLKLRQPQTGMHIVFVSSLAGKVGFEGLSIYTATKFAIEGLCEALKAEYKDKTVDFTILRPGITDTNFFTNANMEAFHRSVKGTKALHSAESVASYLLAKIARKPRIITVGNDKYFVRLLPFIPFSQRFKVLDMINKL